DPLPAGAGGGGPRRGSGSFSGGHSRCKVYNRADVNVLLLRPDPGNERFGLGPFFRVEPLGLEYVAASLTARGHETTILDLRFGHRLSGWIRRSRLRLVGI